MAMPEHTAKAFDVDLQELTRMVAEMGGLAERQIADAVDALARRDADRAQRTVAGDPSIDALCTSVFRELLTYMMEDARNITYCIHLMFCAKNIERMGDHATNIAETVYYMIEGHAIADQRPKGDTTSFATLAAEK